MSGEFRELNTKLGFEFSTYATTNLEWELMDRVPLGASIVIQTDEPNFNAWALEFAEECRKTDDEPTRPWAIVHLPVGLPLPEQLPWEKATLTVREFGPFQPKNDLLDGTSTGKHVDYQVRL